MSDEGFDLIKVLPPSSRRQATVHRTVAFRWVRIPLIRSENKNTTQMGGVFILAEDEGFEPPQTESESGVLPLHKSSMLGTGIIISINSKKSSSFFLFSKDFFAPGKISLPGAQNIMQAASKQQSFGRPASAFRPPQHCRRCRQPHMRHPAPAPAHPARD